MFYKYRVTHIFLLGNFGKLFFSRNLLFKVFHLKAKSCCYSILIPLMSSFLISVICNLCFFSVKESIDFVAFNKNMLFTLPIMIAGFLIDFYYFIFSSTYFQFTLFFNFFIWNPETLILGFSSFIMWAFKSINFLLIAAFTTSHRFGYVVLILSFS